MINPGTQPITDANADLAATALEEFLAAVRECAVELEEVPIRYRVAGVSGAAMRNADADRDGRFAWDVPISDGSTVQVLVPGVEVAQMRNDLTAAAPCLYVGGVAAWWSDAVGSLANVGMALRPL